MQKVVYPRSSSQKAVRSLCSPRFVKDLFDWIHISDSSHQPNYNRHSPPPVPPPPHSKALSVPPGKVLRFFLKLSILLVRLVCNQFRSPDKKTALSTSWFGGWLLYNTIGFFWEAILLYYYYHIKPMTIIHIDMYIYHDIVYYIHTYDMHTTWYIIHVYCNISASRFLLTVVGIAQPPGLQSSVWRVISVSVFLSDSCSHS